MDRGRPAPAQVRNMSQTSRRSARPALQVLDDRTAPATFTVTSLVDDTVTPGTLRDALTRANDEVTNPGPDTVVFAPGLTGTIPLTRTLDVTSSVTIQGPTTGSG